MNESEKKIFHIHLVSDATGETINNIARACLVQYENMPVQEHFWSLIRTERQLSLVFDGLRQWPGLVLFTFVDQKLRDSLTIFCRKNNLISHSVLEPVLSAMSAYLGRAPTQDPGRQHVLDEEYFARIDAMDYALSLDDGNKIEKLSDADVIVLGVSRTSKTPTCIYLSHRGIRAANVPIIPSVPLEVDLRSLEKPFIVGLTKDPESLVETRLNRVKLLNQKDKTDYTDIEKVREEVLLARRLFNKIGCPIIDVTRRSIEETAAEIMMLMNKRELEKAKGKTT